MKYLFLFVSLFGSTYLFAQGTTGLIAHWDMDGTVNDVSGHGHNGSPTALTLAADRFGRPNKAYSFNGTSSVVTVPYASDLQLSNYSICAILKPTGFYSGLCQGNFILTRGTFMTAGSYTLQYQDNMNDGIDCNAFDATKFNFCANAGSCAPPTVPDWAYTPTIAGNNWYRVIATWDGVQFKIFVNGVLKNTAVSTTGTFGTSTDGLSIGKSIFDGATYPYPVTGVIDDIRIYDRLLNDSEVIHYGDTCGVITLQPSPSTTHVAGTATFKTASNISGAAYQWQQDVGSGFSNLSNAGVYSGVTTPTLTVTGVTAGLNNAYYRCVITNSWVCTDTTASAKLTVPVGVNNVINNDDVMVFPDPANTAVTVHMPYAAGSVKVQLVNSIGLVVLSGTFTSNNYVVDVSKLPVGVYYLVLKGDGFTVCKKILHN